MATASKTATGFKVPCPKCGAIGTETDDGLVVELGTLTLRCAACTEEVTVRDLQAMVNDAQRLIRWLDAAAAV